MTTPTKQLKAIAAQSPESATALAIEAILPILSAEKAKNIRVLHSNEVAKYLHVECEMYRGEHTLDVMFSVIDDRLLRATVESFRRHVAITSSDSAAWKTRLGKDLGMLLDAVSEVVSHDKK